MSKSRDERVPGDSSGASAGRNERRTAQRCAVEFFVRERDGDRLFVHPALNLSASGVFLESHSYSLRNAMDRRFVDLEFELPGSEQQFSVRGEVIGARRMRGFSHGLAVRFIDLDPALREQISDFVDACLREGVEEGPSYEAAPTSP